MPEVPEVSPEVTTDVTQVETHRRMALLLYVSMEAGCRR